MSTKLKVIAVLLLLIHHLFGSASATNYISILKIHDVNIELILSRFSKICVAMFMFLSGYGFYITLNAKKYSLKKNVDKILRIYLQYLVVFLLFIPYGLYSGIFSMNLTEFLKNLFTISSSYNGAWWYIGAYIYILALYPIFIYTTQDHTLKIIIFSLLLFLIAVMIQSFPNLYLFKSIAFMKNTFIWQVIFFQGYIFSKKSLFKYFNFIRASWVCILTIILIFIIRSVLPLNFSVYKSGQVVVTDFFLAPIFIFSISRFLKKPQPHLSSLGKHTTNIWLTHIFIQETYFYKMVFYPRFSLFILLVEIILTILASYIINYLLNGINFLIALKKRRPVNLNAKISTL